MRKALFLLLLVLQQMASAQVADPKISVEFKEADRRKAIEIIESASPYRFYFQQEWLEADKTPISGKYENASLAEILEALLDNTTINYYIDQKRVILTNNSIIYDKLPDDFFSGKKPDTTANRQNPVFQKEYDSISKPERKETTGIKLIGKEKPKAAEKRYTLTGYVRNPKTGAPVSNLTVRIQGENIRTTTDANGFYSLSVPTGLNTVETESMTHRKFIRKIMVYSNGKLDLEAVENINQLEEVKVAGNTKQTMRTAVTGVTTIEAEAIKNIPIVFGERDILKVALTIPGIKTAGEGSAGYNVRGGKEDQNLILLDNGVLYNPAHFFGFFSALNPFTTRKVDIYKGSIPAEFGGRLSSVFDITTKNGNYDKFTGEAGIGPVTSNISLSTPIAKGKSSLILGGRATYSGWILKNLDDESLKNSKASFYDAILKYSHKINAGNTLEATAYYSRDAFNISSDSLYKYSNRLVSLKWDHTFNAKSKGALVLTNSEYQFNIDYQADNPDSFNFGYKITETQMMLKFNYALSEKHRLSYGLSGKLYNINPGYMHPQGLQSTLLPIDIEKEKGLESALYVADSYKISDALLIDIGLRYSYFMALGKSTQRIYQHGVPLNDDTVIETRNFSNNQVIKSYDAFEPRIAARYFLAEDFSVKAGFDKTSQYIHLLSSNTTQSPVDTWKLSDLNVKPQQAEQFSVGLYKNFRDGQYEASLEGYSKRSKNILDYKVAATLLLNENVETELLQGEGKSYGVEFLLRKQSGKLNGWIGYTYSRSMIRLDSKFNEEKVNNGQYFAANFDKPHDFSLVLNYKLTKRYSISGNFIYQTGRPITYPVGTYTYNNAEYTLYSNRNEFRIPDYYRLDLGVNIEGNHKIKKLAHSFWNISVYNVLGRNNPYSVYFVTKNGEIKGYKTSIFAIPVPTITYNFKF